METGMPSTSTNQGSTSLTISDCSWVASSGCPTAVPVLDTVTFALSDQNDIPALIHRRQVLEEKLNKLQLQLLESLREEWVSNVD